MRRLRADSTKKKTDINSYIRMRSYYLIMKAQRRKAN